MREVVAYILASCAATVTMIALYAFHEAHRAGVKNQIDVGDALLGFLFFTGMIILIMAIPSLIFLGVSAARGGPRLFACSLFGGLSGPAALILLSGFQFPDDAQSILLFLIVSVSGAGAGVTYWLIARFRRSSEH